MKHGSLFSGVGGFDLAAEWMGWENVFHCEIDSFCSKVLKYYWPKSISYEDITKTDFSIHRGSIDIISGGFPCQPFSQAGKRKGTNDSRYLWPEMLRVIREISPRWVVGENVLGLVNWDGGLVFDTVCADLENEGFKVIPVVLPAAGVGAPHIRQRIFFIAHSLREGWGKGLEREHNNSDKRKVRQDKSKNGNKVWGKSGDGGSDGVVANADNKKLQRGQSSDQWGEHIKERPEVFNNPRTKSEINIEQTRSDFEKFPSVSPICDGDDGLSDKLDNITFSKWRKESIKAGGNAVVPNLVHTIFKTIEKFELIEDQN